MSPPSVIGRFDPPALALLTSVNVSLEPAKIAVTSFRSEGRQLRDTPDVPHGALFVSLGFDGGPKVPDELIVGTLTVATTLSPNWFTVMPFAVSFIVTQGVVDPHALARAPAAVLNLPLIAAVYA